jgi:hypothetical protein
LIAACAAGAACRSPGYPPAPTAPLLGPTKNTYIGVYESSVPESYAAVSTFAKATGARVSLALYYSGWYERFRTDFGDVAWKHGATPVVQIDPSGVSLTAIATGYYDGFLYSYAAAVRAYGHPVIIGFGHEVNAPWYPWGWKHATPRIFVASWRHIVQVFRNTGANNAIWMWTISAVGPGVASPRAWWPGSQYVRWVGIDGYYKRATDTFSNVFGHTITTVRRITRDPVIISETAVAPAAGQARGIHDLFAGVKRYHLLGLIWFDKHQHGDTYHQDWHLADHPVALAAFRMAAAGTRAPA